MSDQPFEELVDALTRAGHPPEHGFSGPEDQVDFPQRVEAFLAHRNPA